jgi:hypothetical protein
MPESRHLKVVDYPTLASGIARKEKRRPRVRAAFLSQMVFDSDHSALSAWVVDLHLEVLNEWMRVLQLKEPVDFRYSLVNQKVQSSTGSTVSAL